MQYPYALHPITHLSAAPSLKRGLQHGGVAALMFNCANSQRSRHRGRKMRHVQKIRGNSATRWLKLSACSVANTTVLDRMALSLGPSLVPQKHDKCWCLPGSERWGSLLLLNLYSHSFAVQKLDMARISNPLLFLATAMVQVQLALATVVSIRDEPAFKAMRECARDCLVWNGSIDLIGELGCVYPYQNECLCRPDLASAASKHLSTCGSAYCTVGPASVDISTAIGLYNSYCVANGFDVTAVAAVAPKTTLATQTNQGG